MKKLLALILGSAMLAPVAIAAQPYGRPGMGFRPGMNGHFMNGGIIGRVRSKQGSSVTLEGGRTIFLKAGTVVNGNIQPGRRISVRGTRAGDRNINATSITVLGR